MVFKLCQVILIVLASRQDYLAIHGGSCSLHQKTPLHWAAEGGNLDTVRCLVYNGADTNIEDEDEVRE